MRLTRHESGWAVDGRKFPKGRGLAGLLAVDRETLPMFLDAGRGIPKEPVLAPIEMIQEVWACGVTYLRSRVEREAESTVADVYAKVYEAERPELFFKSSGWRVVGPGEPIRIRRDSAWNVPEPELTLVVNAHGEVVGYTAGNDVSSRSIEGENPLYLPQAKVYDGACALGSEIVIATADELRDLPIRVSIRRGGEVVYQGEARTSQMKRSLEELVEFATREMTFPYGLFLMTGTGIVPPPEFTLQPEDEVEVVVGEVTLVNPVAAQ